MHSIQWGFRIRALALTLVAIAAIGEITAAQVQTVPAAATNQSAGFCGGRPLCFEGGNFAATITEFRTSEQNGFKIIDAMVHFQNKTNQPLILGYVDGSASAIDDRGNRFTLSPYGGNGVRGMGVISGNSMDPKFMLPAGGASDARFELLERLGQLQGVTYETELSIREINRIEGGQFVLGGETLMHYQGLANGMGVAAAPSSVPGQVPLTSSAAGQNPCGSIAGTAGSSMGTLNNIAGATNSATLQNTTSNATNQVSNATNTLSSLGSLFGRKKAAAPVANNSTTTASANPCPVTMMTGTSSVASPVYSSAPAANAMSPQPVNSTATAVMNSSTAQPAITTQPVVTTGAAKAVVAQPLRTTVQPIRTTTTVKTAVQTAPVQQAKAPAQPVKAVVKTPVPIPAAKKPVQ